MTQIRNVLSKWHQGSTVFLLTSRKTQIARSASEPRLQTGNTLLRAETFGDLVTADHKVLNERCESRNTHRHSVVVQDLGTQWIQSYRCKTKTSQETEESLPKFLEPKWKLKVIYIDSSPTYGKACEDLSWNHRTSTPIDPRRKELLKEQCAESWKGHLQYCCNQAWMKNGGLIPWNAIAICEN